MTQLINQNVVDEDKFMPFARQFLVVSKDYERPSQAASSLARSNKTKGEGTKPKRKAAPKKNRTATKPWPCK